MDSDRPIIRSLEQSDLALLHAFVEQQFGGEPIVTPANLFRLEQLSCLKAVLRGKIAGFVCYHCADGACEIVILGSLLEGEGVGTALLSAARNEARKRRCACLRVFTTNDNAIALGFYQKRGFAIVATHIDAMDRVRKYKPLLPATGNNGVPLRDMIELEMTLA